MVIKEHMLTVAPSAITRSLECDRNFQAARVESNIPLSIVCTYITHVDGPKDVIQRMDYIYHKNTGNSNDLEAQV